MIPSEIYFLSQFYLVNLFVCLLQVSTHNLFLNYLILLIYFVLNEDFIFFNCFLKNLLSMDSDFEIKGKVSDQVLLG